MIIDNDDLIPELQLRELEILLTIGAGDIDKLVESIKNNLSESKLSES